MEGIGTFLMSPDEAEASALSALRSGYSLIDTANAYCNEKAVGRAMKRSGLPRKDIFLETKLCPASMRMPTPWVRPLSVWARITSTCC